MVKNLSFETAVQSFAGLVEAALANGDLPAVETLTEAISWLCDQGEIPYSNIIGDRLQAQIHKLSDSVHDATVDPTPAFFLTAIRRRASEAYNGRPSFEALVYEMWCMQRKKGADYGSEKDPLANIKGSEEWGIPAWLNTLLRIDDKRQRLMSFVRRGDLVNESPADAFIDFAVYAVHAVRLFREWLAQKDQVQVTVTASAPKVCYVNPADE